MKNLLSSWFRSLTAFENTPVKQEFSIADPTSADPKGLNTVTLAVSPSDGQSPTMVSLYFEASGVKLFEKQYQDDQDAQTELSAMAKDLNEAAVLSKEGKIDEAKNLVSSLIEKYKRSSDTLVQPNPTSTMTQASMEPLQYKGWKISKLPEGGYIAEHDVMSLRADSVDTLKAKIDNATRKAMGKKLKAGIILQNVFFDTPDEAMEYQEKMKALQGPEGSEEGKPLWEQMNGEEKVAPSNETPEGEDEELAPPSLSFDRIEKDKAKTDKDIGKRIKEQVKTEVESALEQKSASVFGKDQEELVEALRKNGRNWDEIKKIFVKELSYNEDDTTVFLDSIRQKEEGGPLEGLPMAPKPPEDLVSPETHDKLVKEIEDKSEPNPEPLPLADEIARADNAEIRKVAVIEKQGNLIYCCGHTASYEKYFKEQGTPNKMGRDTKENYPGGSVWKTYAEAKAHCLADYSVYGVQADWNKDTVASKDGDWNDLLVDSPLVKLDTAKIAGIEKERRCPKCDEGGVAGRHNRFTVSNDGTETCKNCGYVDTSNKREASQSKIALNPLQESSQKCDIAKCDLKAGETGRCWKHEDHAPSRESSLNIKALNPLQEPPAVGQTPGQPLAAPVEEAPTFDSPVPPSQDSNPEPEFLEAPKEGDRVYVMGDYETGEDGFEGTMGSDFKSRGDDYAIVYKDDGENAEVALHRVVKASQKKVAKAYYEKKAAVTDSSRGRNWKVTYYDKNDKVISSRTIKDRTEAEAEKEATGDMPSGCEDWSMMPVQAKKAANEDRWTKLVYECPSCETRFTESKKPMRACPVCRTPADKIKLIKEASKKKAGYGNDYSGYTNRSTWGLSLWLDNDQHLYDASRKLAAGARDADELAAMLRHRYSGILESKQEQGMSSKEVNWKEIAQDLLGEHKENAEYEHSQSAPGIIESLPIMDVEKEKDTLLDQLAKETDPEKKKVLEQKYKRLSMASIDPELQSLHESALKLKSELEREGEIAIYFHKEGIEKKASDDSAFEANGWCRVWIQDIEIESDAKYPAILKLPDENARIAALKDLARNLAYEALRYDDDKASELGVQHWFESLTPSQHDRIDWVKLASPVSEEEEDQKFEDEMGRKYGPEAVHPDFRTPENQSSQNPKIEKKAADPVPSAEGPKEVPTQFKQLEKAPVKTQRELAQPATEEQAKLVQEMQSSLTSLEAIKTMVAQAKVKLNEEIKNIEQSGGRVQIESELKQKMERLAKLVEATENQMINAGDTVVRLVQETKDKPFRPDDKWKVQKLVEKFAGAQEYLDKAIAGAQSLATTEQVRDLVFFPRKSSQSMRLSKKANFLDTLDSVYNDVLSALKLIIGSEENQPAAV